jgi:CBS domain containing-hemolysin-like protein
MVAAVLAPAAAALDDDRHASIGVEMTDVQPVWALVAGIGAIAAASFFAAAIAGLAALGRWLEERERETRTLGLTSFLLADVNAAATTWMFTALLCGGVACLGFDAAWRGGTAGAGALRWLLAASVVAILAILGVVAWKRLAESAPRAICEVAAILSLPVFLLLYPLRRPLAAALQRLYPPLTLREGVMYTDDIKEAAVSDDGPQRLERDEREMIARVFELGETVVREIMVPRIDMVALEESLPIHEVMKIVRAEGHSRLPVYRGSIDQVIGFLYIKDLITRFDQLDQLHVCDLVRPVFFVPETKRVDALLAEMRSRRAYLGIVVDEYGGTSGLVTMEDVIEEVVGEIHDELDEVQLLVHPLEDGAYRVDAKVDLDDLNAQLGVHLPADEYDTLGGLLYALAGKIPVAGDRFEYEGVEFGISAVRGKRITQVVVRVPRAQTADDAAREGRG